MSNINIYQKIVEIRKNIDGFVKDTKGFQYKYVSGTQVLAKIINKMNELGVVLEPQVVAGTKNYEIFQYTTIDKNGKEKKNIDYLVTADMVMRWVNAENPTETIEVPWLLFGQQDEISKAFGSGLTYSERYFLMKYFSVPTDEDDPDSRQKQFNSPSNEPKPQSNSKPQPSNGNLTEKQIKRLYGVAYGKGIDKTGVDKLILKKYKANKPSELTKQQYDEVIANIEENAESIKEWLKK